MRRHPLVILVLLVLGLTVPFLDKPIHIDDTFVLRVTDQVLETPWDPFRGEFNWFGHLSPVWSTTTNPPLVSYWLAPVAALLGPAEIPLHLAFVPFYLLFAWGVLALSRRFTRMPWGPVLFFLCSAPFLVSGNLMRDIPAGALAVSGIALFIVGVDRGHRGRMFWGSLLMGLAVLAKYSVGVILPVAGLYALLKRRPSALIWLSVSALVVGAWCLQTWWVYGQIHPWYLLQERVEDSGISWQDKSLSALAILGSAVFLQPLIVGVLAFRRNWKTLAALVVAGVGAGWWGYRFYDSDWDPGFTVWVVLGTILLVAALRSMAEDGFSGESLFLGAWLISHVLFSCFFVPFNAVRHLLVALPPLLLLLFRWLNGRSGMSVRQLQWTGSLLILQAVVALLIHSADYEYADTYRDFAQIVRNRHSEDATVWFVGHWGWKSYAEQAGLQMMNRDGPYPDPGDLLVWPRKVHIGDCFGGPVDLRPRLELTETYIYPGRIPVRTMSLESRAGFYAVIRRRIPYRFDGSVPLEIFQVFRVEAEETNEEN